MDLYREVIHCINELEQQGEMVAEGVINRPAYQFVHIDLQQILKRVAGMRTVHHLRRIFLHIGHHPCLAYVLVVGRYMIVPLRDGLSSPDLMEQLRFELERI